MQWKIPLADLNYGPEEEEAVARVIRSRWLTMGEQTSRFEEEFRRFTGARHAFALSNCTVALHLACAALEIGPEDEVIVPSLSFVATANAVLYTGAKVRFADIIGPADLTLSPQSVQSLINDRTKAIVVMHYGGYPCQMDEIMQIARAKGLRVIEDVAHAPGAWKNGKHLGTIGDVGCFSFFSNKNLSTGEGGMLITDQDDIADRVRKMRSHGMTTLTWDRHRGHAYSYDVIALGYNYRIDEIRAALGIQQLEKLLMGNNQRKAITESYWKTLQSSGAEFPFRDAYQGIPAIETESTSPEQEKNRTASACHIFPLLLPKGVDRLRFIDGMKAAGIQTSIHYPPIHRFEYYRKQYPNVALPTTEDVAAREVTLPLYPGMTPDQVEYVTTRVQEVLKASEG